MSIATRQSISSTQCSVTRDKLDIFQDLPILDRQSRLTVIETANSDKQVINELVYRWCRILTRLSKKSLSKLAGPSDTPIPESRKILILDLVGSISLIRLATVLKRDERRMQMIGIVRGCKINSTYVTLSSHINQQTPSNSLKLVVIYQDEFYIMKTISMIKEFLVTSKSQVLLVIPRLDRQEKDVLCLSSNFQTIKCDFCVHRREIGSAAPGSFNDSYSSYLNRVQFQRFTSSRILSDKIIGELQEDGLYLLTGKQQTNSDAERPSKRVKKETP